KKLNKIDYKSKLNEKYIDSFDLVLCDVPCSGLGVISKKPDIRYNFDSDKLDSLKDIQKAILDTSKKYVKNNGYLSYSTCTITDEENSDNVRYFLKNNKDFELIYEKKLYQNKNDRSDGFYVAIMKKI
ncbi:MAG: 16S rRNA (cytosine(967)-C(5))-methyltransferase RsmB, partial [Lachnospiraceae bacterium]|nr:16S rRNA (cytosine(967)-C(5))-methyltransferase RsmB [Lachnospiraceae bacterium]